MYVKDKGCLEYGGEEAGYASYPYLDPGFRRGVMIPIESRFHDRMFQFSKVQGNATPMSGKPSVFNGITKIYIATPFEHIDYRPGDIAFIYRI